MRRKLIPILLLTAALIFAAGCVAEEPAKAGDTVSVYYTLILDDGTIKESNVGKTPLTFVLGSGHVVPGFDAAVTGMTVGQTKTVRLAPSDAYGEITEDMIQQMNLADIISGTGSTPEVGDIFQVTASNASGTFRMYAKILSIDSAAGVAEVAIMPSALTGEYLTFEITLDSIVR